MSEGVRVRFAPSPTGYLHVGGARTALFNWLFARQQGGAFILRIEDTDRERSSDAMVQAIVDGMDWLGLHPDEQPYHQADGVQRHRRDALRLMEEEKAYRCFCTPAELDAKRAAAEEREGGYRYDRHCRLRVSPEESAERAAAGEPFTIRFKVPEGETAWTDVVHERMRFANPDIEDFIILRTDGTPIYNLAVVSDDHEMGITHVIRGDDHLSNTPKQILLYEALGWEVPRFAHLPMILGADGKRLSKRHGATAVGAYREAGILPVAMVNFLALLGWSPGDDTEVMDREELVQRFSLDRVNRKSAVFDTEKLEWLNGQHLSRKTPESLEQPVTDRLLAKGVATAEALARERPRLLALLALLRTRARTVDEIAERARPYLVDAIEYDEAAVAKHWGKKPEDVAERLRRLRESYAGVEEWSEERLEAVLRGLADELGVGAGKLIHPLRVALVGQAVSPGIFEVLVVMGRARTLARLDAAIERVAALAASR
ncbi:MAG: glutamate--tRNA ligase [Gemmatimonadota bacterium]